MIDNLLSSILQMDGGGTFYAFSNADGKRWIMPAHNMRVSMNLYQPSGMNGKMVKTLFPWLHGLKAVRHVIHAEKMTYCLKPELEAKLIRLFGVTDIEFAIFCGTPCVHQKITMQVSRGKRILGYCKFSDNKEIVDVFKKEKDTLDFLHGKGLTAVPMCLYCGELEKGMWMFAQTTTKSLNSTIDHTWRTRETMFLKDLHEKTKRTLCFGETDYHNDICWLFAHLDWIKSLDKTGAVSKSIEIVLDRLSKQSVDYSFHHGDFTPWNTYVEQGRLYAFDLEYAKRTYPPHLDYFHFFTQTAIFEKHLDADGVWQLYQKNKRNADELFGKAFVDFSYLLYLLNIIAHFSKREKGTFGGDVLRTMRIWIELTKLICNELEKE